MKKHIIHIIDSLELGGAEVLLINSINNLNDYRHTIITLKDKNSFDLKTIRAKVESLNHTGKKIDLFRCTRLLKSYFKLLKPDIVHSHLYWSTMLTRLAVQKKIKVVSTYHSLLYDPLNTAQYSPKMLWLDKLTYRDSMHSIFISHAVKDLIAEQVGITKKLTVIPNYINDEFYTQDRINFKKTEDFRLVAVGNLKPEKNYINLVKAFSLLPDNICLDIVGDGPMLSPIKKYIAENNIRNVKLLGKKNSIAELLTQYHAYTMASSFEGFGIALVEAMAIGLPCIVSDIPTFKEIDSRYIQYFDHTSPKSIAAKIEDLSKMSIDDLKKISQALQNISSKYSLSNYAQNLNEIYTHK